MSDDELARPFKREEFLDKEGIVGARWWHEGLAAADPVGRRTALRALLVGGGLLAVGVMISKSSACGPDTTTVNRGSLDVQKEYGWEFGARGEALTFDGAVNLPFDPANLATLVTDLAPKRRDLTPYYVPTLFQACYATPTSFVSGETTTFELLARVLRPIFTQKMDIAYRAGKALAALFNEGKSLPGTAVVVDLAGPESIAFAAGAAQTFEPVFAVDNWPHPRGVVPAHLTLAAAAYYQPLFVKAAAARGALTFLPPVSSTSAPPPPSVPPPAPPLFVLDRSRLSLYTDENNQFDNRHLAKLPSAPKLAELGVRRLLYVVPLATDVPELDDLNDDFVRDRVGDFTIKIVGVDAFGPYPSASPSADPVFYYARQGSSDAFWVDYRGFSSEPPRTGGAPSGVSSLGRNYIPVRRETPFSGQGGQAGRAIPPTFGVVPVVIAVATGAVVGTIFSRSGSWGRSSGGWGG